MNKPFDHASVGLRNPPRESRGRPKLAEARH